MSLLVTMPRNKLGQAKAKERKRPKDEQKKKSKTKTAYNQAKRNVSDPIQAKTTKAKGVK